VSLARAMTLAAAAVAVLVGAAFAALLLAISSQRSATAEEAHSKDVTAATLRLEKLVVDLETGIRGWTLTVNQRVLEPYLAARRDLPARVEALRRLVADDPQAKARTEELATEIDAYVVEYAAPLVQIVRETPDIAKVPSVTDEGNRRTFEIRQRFTRLLATENERSRSAAAMAEDRAQNALVVGAIGFAASTALIVLFGLALSRSIARPVRAAAAGATRMAGGDLAVRLPAGGPGEVGELVRAFNVMGERLESGRAELEEQNKALRESERMKTELVNIVSHELRTPLASVLGFTALLLKRDFDTPTRRHYLGIVDVQAQRLAALLEDFLDVQRIEHEGLELDAAEVDLGKLLGEQVQLYAAQSPTHRLELDLEEPALRVRGDPNRLAQVVGNLLSNAIKYSPQGSLVELAARRSNGVVRIDVRDEGRGIAPSQQDRIFTKFFRGDAAATGITGTGLGLAVSREIVEAHGGRMGFESSPAVGSTVWVELPGEEGLHIEAKKETG
jgi:two-component system, sensor histidine kinase and response regulator